MNKKIPTSNKFLLVALASGLIFGLLLVYMPHGSGTTNTYSDLAIVLISQLSSIVVVALLAGWMLRDKIANAYIVSTFALLYLYTFSRLVVFARLFDDIVYILLLTTLSIAAFSLSNTFFNKRSVNATKKTVVAAVVFIALLVFCAPLGLVLSRSVAPFVIS